MDAQLGLSRIIDEGVSSGTFPGAVAMIVTPEGNKAVSVGRLTYDRDSAPTSEKTIFDVASLTKVVCTATAVAMLLERGDIRLETRARQILPELSGIGTDSITIEHLLSHTAGYSNIAPIYKISSSASEFMERIYELSPEAPPGSRRLYDDVSYIILGKIVERVTGTGFDDFCRERIFRPLRMKDATFKVADADLGRTAPTEIDPTRGGLLRGAVHDENAYALGGVAGHAGLFMTILDMAHFMRSILDIKGAKSVISRTSAEQLREYRWTDSSGGYGLSWDRYRPGYMLGVDPADVFGHTGFTGTAVVAAPSKKSAVILFANFVHPVRKDREQMDRIRRAVVKAALGQL